MKWGLYYRRGLNSEWKPAKNALGIPLVFDSYALARQYEGLLNSLCPETEKEFKTAAIGV